ncbi:MAG: tautomerase family protein [Alphaproteobacteria bacterium]|nr:tautomerase family protein [Alphaproteobacteria bacterium]
MPISHISMRAGKTEAYRQAIFDSLYRALREALNVPEDDRFMTISEHDAGSFRYGNAFGVDRSDDLIYVRVTLFDTRTTEQKKTFYRMLTDSLGDSPGLRPEDVFITLVETPKPNWSVGNGVAQFV